MAKYRPFLLIVACFALAAVVGFDNRDAILSMLVSSGPTTAPNQPVRAPVAVTGQTRDGADESASPPEAGLLTGNPIAEFDKTTLNNWVQRPLFAPSRKRPPPQDAKQASAPPPAPPDYQLLGVLLNPVRTIAVLRSEGTGADIRVQVGDMIGGWRVASVERDAVTLKREEEEPQIIRFKKECSKSTGTACP